MADLGARSFLPNDSHSFSISTLGQSEPREKHKNYVFVDEHNRHRRLKVMRACAACRRRKIKCDAATTNTWPCAPCVKQQLECVPPSSDKDGVDGAPEEPAPTGFHAYHSSITSNPNAQTTSVYPQQARVPSSYGYPSSIASATSEYYPGSISSSDVQAQSVGQEAFTPITPQDFAQQGFHTASIQKSPTSHSVSAVSQRSDSADGELSNVMQDLKIDQGGVAHYIANQQNALANDTAVEEQEAILPPQPYPNTVARIPSEMWPSEQQAKQYFDHFFGNIHPYVPVVNRTSFIRQWQADRHAISPLILEGIFACSAHQLGHHNERARWLALAQRHEESFKDVPRLPTIQGLILILKARESTPRRGYYYRSWMTIQFMISMAKDLQLDEHNILHVQGRPCEFDSVECNLKTRIWHTLFQMELMVGGPQGRLSFNIDPATVNLNVPQSLPGLDYSELKISQDQTYFVRLIHNIRRTAHLYMNVKRNGGDFGSDKAFLQHNQDYFNYEEELPQHLRVKFPEDGSAPSIPFHFVANLQSYQLLALIMHHRPQLENAQNYEDGSWKGIMITCYNAATKICRLHEAILNKTGMNGYLCMLRGINTVIYTTLSCLMLHLVALTCPDPELNQNAKDYFTRHMRILERCSSSWPVPQIQVQIESLRQAFSADLDKPFEMKANVLYGSPRSSQDSPTPPADSYLIQSVSQQQQAANPSMWATTYETNPMTPPHTTACVASQPDILSATSYTTQEQGYPQATTAQWDPSPMFDKWHTAFNPSHMETPSPGMHGATMQGTSITPTSVPMYGNATQGSYFNGQAAALAASQAGMSPTYSSHMSTGQTGFLAQGPATTPSAYGPSIQPYVTPSMWRDTVAQTYGSKRRWDGEPADQTYKRLR